MKLNQLSSLNGADPFSFKLGQKVVTQVSSGPVQFKAVPGKPHLSIHPETGRMQYAPPRPQEESTHRLCTPQPAPAPVAPTRWIRCSDRIPDESGWYEADWGYHYSSGLYRYFDREALTWSRSVRGSPSRSELEESRSVVIGKVSDEIWLWIEGRIKGGAFSETTSEAKKEPVWEDRSTTPKVSGWYRASVYKDKDRIRYFDAGRAVWSGSGLISMDVYQSKRTTSLNNLDGPIYWINERLSGYYEPEPAKPEWTCVSKATPSKSGWYPCSSYEDSTVLRYWYNEKGMWGGSGLKVTEPHRRAERLRENEGVGDAGLPRLYLGGPEAFTKFPNGKYFQGFKFLDQEHIFKD